MSGSTVFLIQVFFKLYITSVKSYIFLAKLYYRFKSFSEDVKEKSEIAIILLFNITVSYCKSTLSSAEALYGSFLGYFLNIQSARGVMGRRKGREPLLSLSPSRHSPRAAVFPSPQAYT